MTRLGWAILGLVLVAAGLFASMLSFGPGNGSPKVRPTAATPPPVTRPERDALVVPVAGVARADLRDGWGDPRDGGARPHRGLDIMAPAGTRVLAAADGVVEKLFNSVRGGTTLYVRSADRRWIHYYAHLSGYAPGLREGSRVRAGQWIADVGDTGDAAPGNHHLHFGVQRMRNHERWWQGEDVNPYPLLARKPPQR